MERAWYVFDGSSMRNRLGIQRGEPLAELVSRLVAPATAWSEPKLADDHVLLVALETLGELGDERAVPYLVMALVTGDGIDTAIAARVLERLMPRDLAGLALLEAKVRDRGWYGYDGWWPDDRPQLKLYVDESSARSALQRGLPTAALGLLSMNANGRVRELAVRGLAAVGAGDELPFLVLRANDWVPEVSTIARRAIERRCMPENAAAFVAVLPLVERLKVQHRVDKSELVEKIETMLVGSPGGVEAIASAMAGARDVSVRRSIARLAIARSLPLEQIERAISDRDVVVRTLLAQAVVEKRTSEQLGRWLPRLFLDKAPRIRSIAFRAAESKLPTVLDEALEQFLFDGNFWLREFARQKLGREPKDFAQTYAAAIAKQDPSTLGVALAGLGEVGTPDDAALLVPHTKTGKSRTRQLALRAVFNLLKAKAVPTLAEALGSDSAGLSKVAAELLLTRGLVVFADDVLPHIRAESAHVRANALRAVAGIDKWEALLAALQCAADPDASVATAARRILALWKYVPAVLYSGPKPGQRERLRAALAAAPPTLNDVRRTINTILAST